LLEKAIHDWEKMEGNVNRYKFANKLGILPQTFYKYVCPYNPRILGDGSCGIKKLMANDDVAFVGCVLTCADLKNDSLSSKEAVDMIQELKTTDITRVAA
jgi:hypothetical protein